MSQSRNMSFMDTIIHDAVEYYRQQDEKSLNVLVYNALAPIFMGSSSSVSTSQSEFEMKEIVLSTAMAQYKEKKQEAIILQKAYSSLTLSKSLYQEDIGILIENIMQGAMKYYEKLGYNLISDAMIFSLLAMHFSKPLQELQQQHIQKNCSIGYMHLLTATQTTSGFSEINPQEAKTLNSNVARAVKDIMQVQEQFPVFQDALFALKETRRVRNALESKEENFVKLAEILLDEVIKLFYQHHSPIRGSVAEKYEDLFETLQRSHGLSSAMINQLVIPQAMVLQATLFLQEYRVVFLKLFPKWEARLKMGMTSEIKTQTPEEKIEASITKTLPVTSEVKQVVSEKKAVPEVKEKKLLSKQSFLTKVNNLGGDTRKVTIKALDKTTKAVTKFGRMLGNFLS